MSFEPTRLEIRQSVSLFPTAPFNFEGTVHKPSHFPSSDNVYESGRYWFTFRFEDDVFGIKLTDLGTIEAPEIQLEVFSSSEISKSQLTKIKSEVEYRFDMQANLIEFYKDYGQDNVLKPVLERWRGVRVSNIYSLYEFLIITTVLQNATVRRSVQMLENLFQAYGLKIQFDEKTLSGFWSPKSIHEASEEELRALKLGYRAKTFKRQAEVFASGEMDEIELRSLPSNDLKARLLTLYGIGPASVWYLLFEVFKRYDAFDYISPWEQKIYSRILFNEELVDTTKILQEVDARWGKWKMLAAHYIFEDLFWQRKTQHIPWLEALIRL